MNDCIAGVFSMNAIVAAVLITAVIIGVLVTKIWLGGVRDTRRVRRELAALDEDYRRRREATLHDIKAQLDTRVRR